jgi:hypothetical protein
MATHCAASRAATGNERISSSAPTKISRMAASVTARNWVLLSFAAALDVSAIEAQLTARVAAITAMPPPCGVAT